MKQKNITNETEQKFGGKTKGKKNWYTNRTYPLILFLLLCCDIVSTYVNIHNRRIGIRAEEK